jgi:hypothetical protein
VVVDYLGLLFAEGRAILFVFPENSITFAPLLKQKRTIR